MEGTLYVIQVPQKEYINLIEDVVRMVLIQCSLQLLLVATDPDQYQFFSSDFLLILIYIILGVCLYWLVFKKLISFK
jgi:hypothetical protein